MSGRDVSMSGMRYLFDYFSASQAYLSGAYTMAEIGCHFGVHYITVNRAVRKFEEG